MVVKPSISKAQNHQARTVKINANMNGANNKWNQNANIPFVLNEEKKFEKTNDNQYEKINFDQQKDKKLETIFERFKKQQENANHFIQLITVPKNGKSYKQKGISEIPKMTHEKMMRNNEILMGMAVK